MPIFSLYVTPHISNYCLTFGPRREKTCLQRFANNTGADQPARPRSLISTFVIRFLERTICKPAIGEISIFLQVSAAEETGLKLALLETPKTGFLATRLIYSNPNNIKYENLRNCLSGIYSLFKLTNCCVCHLENRLMSII